MMLGTMLLTGLLIIGSAFVTGWLVFRTKREQHEALLPRLGNKTGAPVVVDEFGDMDEGGEEIISEIVKKQNEAFAAQFARDRMKDGKDV